MDETTNEQADSTNESPTLGKLVEKIEAMFALKQLLKEKEALLEKEKSVLADMTEEIKKTLEAGGLENFSSKSCTVSVQQKTSVKVPKSPEQREAFFGYLKERGVFEDLITVNSQTLNSWYNAEKEEFDKTNPEVFAIPGLDDVNDYTTLSVRKK